MKKLIPLSCFIAGAFSLAQAVSSPQENHIYGHTFFSIRPVFRTAMPERVAFYRYDLLDNNCGNSNCWEGGSFEIVPLGGKSLEPSEIARFFLPGNCNACCLTVQEFTNNLANAATSNQTELANLAVLNGLNSADVDARHFNIKTNLGNYKSTICFKPRHKFVGAGLCWTQVLKRCDGHPSLFVEFSTPILRVRNTMYLEEHVINNGGGAVPGKGLDNAPYLDSMIDAFRQLNWNYGKIDNCSACNERTGFADLEFKILYNLIYHDTCTVYSHLGVVAPTGNKPRQRVVFEPMIGNNHHWGLFFGSSIHFNLWERENRHFEWNWDISSRYLFHNYQTRTFDLVGKPWSRYMAVYQNISDARLANTTHNVNSGTSGINVFTRCVRVTPQFQTDINSAFVYTHDTSCGSYILEAGWNFYAQQAEKIELENCCLGAALKDIKGAGHTTYAATISTPFAGAGPVPYSATDAAELAQGPDLWVQDGSFAALSSCDIDLDSASHPAFLSAILYGSVGYQWCENCPRSVSVGGSWEGGAINSVLNRWTIWGKFVATY